VREAINRDDVCETMPNPTDGRIGKRLYGRVGAREFHIILVVNPGDTCHHRVRGGPQELPGRPKQTEAAMNEQRPRCAVCNLGGHLVDEPITETDDTRAVIVVVRHVPAQVCDRCGTTTVTDEVAEELDRIADAQQGNAVSGTVVVDFDQRRIAAAG
jgi:YgiT-type zinc finger domain-containing protein